jgi:MraZ protein
VEPLFGRFEHSLDSKGRVIVPAPLRHRFEREQNAAVISFYQEKCLALWPPAEFNRRLATVMEVQDLDADHRQAARMIAAHSSSVDIDTQWRITVPGPCRQWAELDVERPVVVVGALDRIELWQVDIFRERMADSMESLANGSSQLFKPPGTSPAP